MIQQESFDKGLIQAVQQATRRLASNGEFDGLLREVLSICVDAVGAHGGTIYLHEEPSILRFQHIIPDSVRNLLPSDEIPDSFGSAGQAFQTRQAVVQHFPEKPKDQWNEFELATGVQVRSMVSTPLQMEGEEPIGVVQLLNKEGGNFSDQDIAVLDTISAVSTLAYLNFKLSDDSARASSLLGMGKVSHDIGNLAATLYSGLSFMEMNFQDIYQEWSATDSAHAIQLQAQVDPMIGELRDSVDRIVGYSRLISDISAGRKVRPNFAAIRLSDTVVKACSYLESQARASRIDLQYNIEGSGPDFAHDELFVLRIVQNLVGNAIKAVSELGSPSNEFGDGAEFEGRVCVGYQYLLNTHEICVEDSGPGISQDMIRRILNGSARSKWEKAGGSGWGMKIVLELTEGLNGQLHIESELGKGSKFKVSFSSEAN